MLARAHRDGIAALLTARKRQTAPLTARVEFPAFPGVPLDWCKGVALLVRLPAPDTIPPARWAVLAATAARLLRDHGAALHGAGWSAVELFGLHANAPATYPPGWGLAWLLGEAGSALDVSPDSVGLCLQPDGARLVYRRSCEMARVGMVPAWQLIEVTT